MPRLENVAGQNQFLCTDQEQDRYQAQVAENNEGEGLEPLPGRGLVENRSRQMIENKRYDPLGGKHTPTLRVIGLGQKTSEPQKQQRRHGPHYRMGNGRATPQCHHPQQNDKQKQQECNTVEPVKLQVRRTEKHYPKGGHKQDRRRRYQGMQRAERIGHSPVRQGGQRIPERDLFCRGHCQEPLPRRITNTVLHKIQRSIPRLQCSI